MAATSEPLPPVAPTPDDVSAAREASRRLNDLLAVIAKKAKGRAAASALRLTADVRGTAGKSEPIPLPAPVVRLVAEALHEMAQGKAVTLVPSGGELSTEQAAHILNVSRPFVSKLVDAGKLPARKVGRHRRIRLEDLMAYKRRDDVAREKALAELAALSQELDMGY